MTMVATLLPRRGVEAKENIKYNALDMFAFVLLYLD